MFCNNCGKKISKDHKFCNYCGHPTTERKGVNLGKLLSASKKVLNFTKKITFKKPSYKTMVGLAIVILIIFSFSYTNISSKIKDAKDLTKKGDYTASVNQLKSLQGNWLVSTFGFQKLKIEDALKKSETLIKNKENYEEGLEAYDNKNWVEAKKQLSKVSENFIKYEDAQTKLNEVENKIVEGKIASAVSEVKESAEEKIESIKRQTEKTEQELKEKQEKLEKAQDKISKSSYDLSNIVDKWSPYVVRVVCENRSGSGIITQFGNWNSFRILTNQHVVSSDGYRPRGCKIKLSSEYIENSILSTGNDALYYDYSPYDISSIYTGNKQHSVYKTMENLIITFNPSKYVCSRSDASEGDEIAILGYPGVGTQGDITVTRGIISGYEDYYYVTDAKVEQGNSGGAAILLKNNCILGIPTWVGRGQLESFGRILDIDKLVE